ncbi:MAG: aldehyde dehydrogenase family protein [Acidimicrobiales bacterium]|nr:aldehyde dehydrogenase family protein [Acidimicrobiales bacterium]
MSTDLDSRRGRMHLAFAAQRAAVLADPVPSLELRLDRVDRVRRLVVEGEDRIRVAMTDDFGSLHPAMVVMLDTLPVIERVNFVEAHLGQWLQPRDVELGEVHGSSRGLVLRTPKGVTGNIAPWNFPIESALVMVVDMLAAGNTCIVKPSELAPATAAVLDALVAEYFSPAELAVVQGGPDLAAEFAAMPWDHLTFTGSARVGRMVMAAAAANLVPVTLELGGKNPAVFAPDAATDDELILRFLAFRTLKAGQICTSPDHALVPRDRLDEWVERAGRLWQRAYPTHVGHRDATGIINAHHLDRLLGYLDEAHARGVRVVGLNDDQPDRDRRQVPLTLVVDPPDDLGCMTDEVFGPVIPVVAYDPGVGAHAVDPVIERINAGPSPLGAYLATRNDAVTKRFVDRVRCGGIGINTFGLQGGHAALPFGGFGASGHGCHGAYEGFCTYSHARSVFHGADDSYVHQVILPPYDHLTPPDADGGAS